MISQIAMLSQSVGPKPTPILVSSRLCEACVASRSAPDGPDEARCGCGGVIGRIASHGCGSWTDNSTRGGSAIARKRHGLRHSQRSASCRDDPTLDPAMRRPMPTSSACAGSIAAADVATSDAFSIEIRWLAANVTARCQRCDQHIVAWVDGACRPHICARLAACRDDNVAADTRLLNGSETVDDVARLLNTTCASTPRVLASVAFRFSELRQPDIESLCNTPDPTPSRIGGPCRRLGVNCTCPSQRNVPALWHVHIVDVRAREPGLQPHSCDASPAKRADVTTSRSR